MLSRAAENLYWLARYLERAEDTARLINATTHLLLDLPRGAVFGWDVLLKVAGLDRVFHESYPRPDEANIMRFLISDERNPGSVVSCVRSAREDCRTLREVLPQLAWERINSLYLFIRTAAHEDYGRTRRYNILNELIERRQSVIGLLEGGTSHDVGYRFIRLGRNIERADMTTRIVDITSAVLLPQRRSRDDPTMNLLWIGVLKALDAYQMYRRHVSVDVEGSEVVNFLLTDAQFPRTVRYCLREMEACLRGMPHNSAPLGRLRAAQARIDGAQTAALASEARHAYLDAVQAELAGMDQEIARQYFYWDDARLAAPEKA